jgi:hypothetical protein
MLKRKREKRRRVTEEEEIEGRLTTLTGRMELVERVEEETKGVEEIGFVES